MTVLGSATRRSARKAKGDGHLRRAEILEAAERIFVAEGYEGATIRKIADEVGVSSTALYMHFQDKSCILLEICDAGVVFLPGAAGTVQEVFQDACENYYATPDRVAPMVLLGSAYWTEVLPAWPLLRSLARGTPMEGHVHLVDSVDEVAMLVG